MFFLGHIVVVIVVVGNSFYTILDQECITNVKIVETYRVKVSSQFTNCDGMVGLVVLSVLFIL